MRGNRGGKERKRKVREEKGTGGRERGPASVDLQSHVRNPEKYTGPWLIVTGAPTPIY